MRPARAIPRSPTSSLTQVVIFSKSFCPYCHKAKDAFRSIGVKPFVMELDDRPDMDDIQNALGNLTGKRSVPRVFIDGVFLGGGDDTAAAAANGSLLAKCQAAGAQ